MLKNTPKYVFIADFFADEIRGGGELNNEELIAILRNRGHEVITQKSSLITPLMIEELAGAHFIVANFVGLSKESKESLQREKYIIYEHDHKYITSRNPALYEDYRAPRSDLINVDFYRNAHAILCQSAFHSLIVKRNLHIDNVISVGGNLWSEEILEHLRNLSFSEKNGKCAIMQSDIPHKNYHGAIQYCKQTNQDYTLIPSLPYGEFVEKLSEHSKLVFLPTTPETLSRIVVEARMMNLAVCTNANIGASSEEWFAMKGEALVEEVYKMRDRIPTLVEKSFRKRPKQGSLIYPHMQDAPFKVSILTSMYKGDDHIEEFLINMTQQSVFDKCELIIVDANSPGSEGKIINKFMKEHDNIKYVRLDNDPGIYGCWNEAIKRSSGEYITNANLDDRRSLQHIEIHARELLRDPDIDLVYSESLMSAHPHENYEHNTSGGTAYPVKDFSPENMVKCLPGCMPMWRKSMHEKYGVFNDKYKFAGDWEMWLRSARGGAIFQKIPGAYGLYYINPQGLSTDKSRDIQKFKEEKEIFFEYKDFFGSNYNHHVGWFSQEME